MIDELELQIPDPIGGGGAEVAPIENPDFEIAGFWRRFLGGLIDWMILAVICWVLITVMGDIPYRLGSSGRYIGWGIGTLYLGFLNSAANNGQSPGKRMVGTILVGADNNLIPLWKSMLRGAILALVCVGSQLDETIPVLGPFLAWFSGIASYWLLYGIFINRITRRGPHDLIMRTYVLNAPKFKHDSLPKAVSPKNRAVHIYIPTILSVVVSLAMVFTSGEVMLTRLFPNTLSIPADKQVLAVLNADLEEYEEIIESSAGWITRGKSLDRTPITGLELGVDIKVIYSCRRSESLCDALANRVISDIRSRTEVSYFGYDRLRLVMITDQDFGWIFWQKIVVYYEDAIY